MISQAHSFDADHWQPSPDPVQFRSLVIAVDAAMSPSLLPVADLRLPAHEVKFLVTEREARHIESVLGRSLQADPHAQPYCGTGSYWTTTVYCDTPQYDIYFRQGRFRRRKYRLRRYGAADVVYVERKTKRGTQVRKQRSPLPWQDVWRLPQPAQDVPWDGDWFQRRVLKYGLSPVLAIRYRRTAYCGMGENGAIRLTFDRDIAGMLATSWIVASFEGGHRLYEDRVVCEFKFRGDMPRLFKTMVEELQLSPSGASKYRSCLASLGGPAHSGGRHA